MHIKKCPGEEAKGPCPIGVGQRPGAAREISRRDSFCQLIVRSEEIHTRP